ncbi:hypothetical protein NPIL_149081 [Nephila pilipes]|uniref:C2H2-type domain-containing protein n=1 Tax=Nephila pilipes TaxID=299642 RepID=A0A8X6QQW6_NEPPI|nr:hypothetical protein NPIL_149081 [Nephila pilipes]
MQNMLLPSKSFGMLSVKKCPYCSYTSSFSGSIKKHMAVHTGDRPYVCDTCQKSFTQKENLKRHLRVHSGERPYQCLICLKKFAQRINLRMHEMKHKKIIL